MTDDPLHVDIPAPPGKTGLWMTDPPIFDEDGLVGRAKFVRYNEDCTIGTYDIGDVELWGRKLVPEWGLVANNDGEVKLVSLNMAPVPAGPRLARLPHLTEEELTVLAHGLNQYLPDHHRRLNLNSVDGERLGLVASSLATAIAEALIEVRR